MRKAKRVIDLIGRYEVEPLPKPRFVKPEHVGELINLYHLARTALSGQDDSRHRRKIWASDQFAKKYPYVSPTGAYKDLDVLLTR